MEMEEAKNIKCTKRRKGTCVLAYIKMGRG
jgi:hypothetical protein